MYKQEVDHFIGETSTNVPGPHKKCFFFALKIEFFLDFSWKLTGKVGLHPNVWILTVYSAVSQSEAHCGCIEWKQLAISQCV